MQTADSELHFIISPQAVLYLQMRNWESFLTLRFLLFIYRLVVEELNSAVSQSTIFSSEEGSSSFSETMYAYFCFFNYDKSSSFNDPSNIKDPVCTLCLSECGQTGDKSVFLKFKFCCTSGCFQWRLKYTCTSKSPNKHPKPCTTWGPPLPNWDLGNSLIESLPSKNPD